jgi:putative transposon-encoded protein
MSRKAITKISKIETTVSESGNGAHVFIPKQWLNKKVKVVLFEGEDEKEIVESNSKISKTRKERNEEEASAEKWPAT